MDEARKGPIILDLDNHFDGGMTSDGRCWYAIRRGYQLSSRPAAHCAGLSGRP
jgi:hypothetical protein